VLSDEYRGLHHYFRQNFSQVTNPPIDSLREARVMTLKTRLGNLGNILDQDESQCRLLQLESPVLLTAEFQAMRAYMGATAVDIDCSFDPKGGDNALPMHRPHPPRGRGRRARRRCACGAERREVSASRASIPMILATAAVHTHLLRQQLRTFTSLNVRSGVAWMSIISRSSSASAPPR